MFYGIVRLIIWILILFVASIIIRKSKLLHKKLVLAITFIFATVLVTVIGLIPVENSVKYFDSPESVFAYRSSGKIEDIIYGKESCMVLSSTDPYNHSYMIIPKTSDGYKLPSAFSTKKIVDEMNGLGSFEIYQVRDTNDYYLSGVCASNKSTLDLSDNMDSEFIKIASKANDNESGTYFIYAYVGDIKDEYYLMINGEKVSLRNNNSKD